MAKPLSIYCDTHGTGHADEVGIEAALEKVMDLTPRGIRTHLGLNRPIFQRTAAYGHFGRAPEEDGGFSWERTDLAEAIKAALDKYSVQNLGLAEYQQRFITKDVQHLPVVLAPSTAHYSWPKSAALIGLGANQ